MGKAQERRSRLARTRTPPIHRCLFMQCTAGFVPSLRVHALQEAVAAPVRARAHIHVYAGVYDVSLCGCVPFAVVVGLLSRVKAENGRRPRRQRAKVGRKEEEVVARLRIMALLPLPLPTKNARSHVGSSFTCLL